MEHLTDVDNITRATRRRAFDDGLMDFVIGGAFLFISLLGGFFFSPFGMRWYVKSLLWNRELTSLALFTLIPLFILVTFGTRRWIDHFRRQTLWKDQGYTQPLRWQVSWQVNVLASAVLVTMLGSAFWLMLNGVVSQTVVLRTLVASAGVATGIVLWGVGHELTLPRYRWVGVTGGGLSALIISMPITFAFSWILLGGVWLVLLFASGAWALRETILVLKAPDRE